MWHGVEFVLLVTLPHEADVWEIVMELPFQPVCRVAEFASTGRLSGVLPSQPAVQCAAAAENDSNQLCSSAYVVSIM